MRVAIYTLGCKVNQYETQAMEAELTGRGHALVPFDGAADAYVINTCTVTAVSDKKSRQMIRQARKRSPHAVVAVCGCYAQTDPEAVEALGVDLVMGTADRMGFLDALEALSPDGGHPVVRVDDALRRRQYEHLPAGGLEGRTRAMLKVEDGCNRQCAYCVIPRARGPVRSRSEESILAELHQLAAAGYQEVVLSAISLPSYGQDTGTDLVELVEHCAAVPGIQRIRLGSLDPDMLTPEAMARLAAVDKLCPQFHLSLQSGCTATLRRMRRVYTAQQYAQVVDGLRAAYGDRPVTFTTDCICGFPGETEADFAESCEFLRQIGFLKVHVFPYSRRSGTPAYDFPQQIHEREKQRRSREMNAVAEQVRTQVLAGFEGTEDEVLLETPLSGTLFTGYTRLYIPVVISVPGGVSGQIVRARLGRYDGERVRAELCSMDKS